LKKPRILIVTEVFYPEEFNINDIALSWKDKGYNVDVLTMTPTYPESVVFNGYKNKFFSRDVYQGINIFRMFAVTGYKNSLVKKLLRYICFMVFGSITAILIGKKYSHVFGFNLGSLTDMVPVIVIGKLYKKRTMLWVQDVWPDSVYAYGFKKTKILSFFLDKFVRLLFHNIDRIGVSAKGFKSKLKPYIKNNLDLNYIPNWANYLDMNLKPIIFSPTKKTNFTFAGNVGKAQNLENIIKAFCLLPDEYQNKSQFNIIGEGSHLIFLKKLSKNNPHIVFHGKQMRKDMGKYYKSSDFLIVSLSDAPIFSVTIPGKFQTCIAVKKPILAIINGEVADIVENNKLGISVKPSNINAIKRIFIKCIDMPQQDKNKFTINNEKLIEKEFNKNIIIKKITKVLLNEK
jgi:glycosyltransferase involved in cell wall biosynthesis